MATIAFMLAAVLDPVQAALVLAIILSYRGPQPIVIAGGVAAVASETIMVLAAFGYTWGELIAPRLVAALLQAAVLCWIVRLVRLGRVTRGIAGVNRFPSNGTTSVGSIAAGSSAHRPAPWHVRAYVSRRIARLRQR